MKTQKWIPIVFLASAVYDGLLGAVFLFWPLSVFRVTLITPPNHIGYVQFPACLLLVFALLFLEIARDPVANRKLIPYGILLKASYCGVIFWHWILTDLPAIWKPFAVFDVVFAVLFLAAYSSLARRPAGD